MMEQIIEDDILTDRQTAEMLQTHWKVIQKLARNGLLRGKKVGRKWRFHKEAVKDFLLRK